MRHNEVKQVERRGMGAWRLLGWKRHTKRSQWGHYFREGVCLDCGKREARKS